MKLNKNSLPPSLLHLNSFSHIKLHRWRTSVWPLYSQQPKAGLLILESGGLALTDGNLLLLHFTSLFQCRSQLFLFLENLVLPLLPLTKAKISRYERCLFTLTRVGFCFLIHYSLSPHKSVKYRTKQLFFHYCLKNLTRKDKSVFL